MNMILRCIECVFRSEDNHFWTSGTEIAYTSGAPEVTSSFRGVRVVRSLVLCLCFVDRCLSFYPFSLGHSVVCPSINDSSNSFYNSSDMIIIFRHASDLQVHLRI